MHVCTVLRYFLTVSTYCIYRTCLDKIQSASLGGQAGRQTDRQAGRQVLVLNVARLTLPLLAVAVAVAGPRFLAAHTHTHTLHSLHRCTAAPLHRPSGIRSTLFDEAPAATHRRTLRRFGQWAGGDKDPFILLSVSAAGACIRARSLPRSMLVRAALRPSPPPPPPPASQWCCAAVTL